MDLASPSLLADSARVNSDLQHFHGAYFHPESLEEGFIATQRSRSS